MKLLTSVSLTLLLKLSRALQVLKKPKLLKKSLTLNNFVMKVTELRSMRSPFFKMNYPF